MAATDVKDIILKPDGYWYKVLCNGTEVKLMKDCDCGGDPQPPLETATDCRLANGLRAKFNSAVAVMSGKMDEQPNNAFGDLEAANQWLEYLYVGYLRGFFPVNALDVAFVVSQHYSDEGAISDGVTNIGYELNCAMYAAYIAQEGVLNEAFKDRFKAEIVARIGDAPNVETAAALVLASELVEFITINLWQSWLYEGSIVDPGEVGDYDCSECIEVPDETVPCESCTGSTCLKFVHDAVPSGYTISGYTSTSTLGSGGKVWIIDGVAGGALRIAKDSGYLCLKQINIRPYWDRNTPAPRNNSCRLIVDGVDISGEILHDSINIFNADCDEFDCKIKFNIMANLGVDSIQMHTLDIKMSDDRSQMVTVQVDLIYCDEA